jgi:hypothetical protein
MTTAIFLSVIIKLGTVFSIISILANLVFVKLAGDQSLGQGIGTMEIPVSSPGPSTADSMWRSRRLYRTWFGLGVSLFIEVWVFSVPFAEKLTNKF